VLFVLARGASEVDAKRKREGAEALHGKTRRSLSARRVLFFFRFSEEGLSLFRTVLTQKHAECILNAGNFNTPVLQPSMLCVVQSSFCWLWWLSLWC